MKIITSEIIIKSTPSQVWRVLTDFEKYPEWNPFIVSLKGQVDVGERITVTIKPVNGSVMIFKPVVLSCIKNKEICWQGNLFVKGLFDGKHSFKLINNNDGTTTFIQSEFFSGIFIPFFSNMIENKTLKGFHLMNEKLKEIVEEKYSSVSV